jgi:ADP-ribose pyrophosphatase YjhB (NUDIX family)
VDYGEDPRDAAVREVQEETGLEIEILRLLDLQGGPGTFGPSIVITFEAHVKSGQAEARDDADAILWLSATDPLPEIAFESTQKMLTAWRASQNGNITP